MRNVEGEFRFTNGTAIDTELSKDRVNSVLNHEYIHNQLYTSTTYGQMVLMLEKNDLFHEKSRLFKDVLFSYMNRMQERTAVNVEVMRECIENGLTAYNTAIEKLKGRNRSYYNYFRKLCCINGKVNSQQAAEQLSTLLVGIATLALNVNPELIPFDTINNPKQLKSYFDHPNNAALISPNRRFDILVNILFRNNDNNNDIESVIYGSIDIERMSDYDYIHSVAYDRLLLVIRDSPIYDRLAKRLESIGVLRFNMDDGEFLSAKPAKLNENNTLIFSRVENKERFYEIMAELNVKDVFVQHSLGGFEDIHMISVYGDKDGKKTVFCLAMFEDGQFYNVLTELSCNVIFNKTKLIGQDGKSIRKMVRKLPIYIYMDTPVISALPFIGSFFYKGIYGFIDMDNYSIFVAYKRSFVFIADIVKGAKEALKDYCLEKSIDYAEDLDEVCNVSEICRIDEECARWELIP